MTRTSSSAMKFGMIYLLNCIEKLFLLNAV